MDLELLGEDSKELDPVTGVNRVDLENRNLEIRTTTNTNQVTIGASNEVSPNGLVAMAREKRERLAAKSDKAEVPVFRSTFGWNPHLRDDRSWGWPLEFQDQLATVVRPFRVHMLRQWKRNMFRSFVENLYHMFPDVAPAVSATVDSMVASVFSVTEPSNHCPVLPTYLWRTDGLGGRIKYCHWWL
jgi:hypothetical protein